MRLAVILLLLAAACRPPGYGKDGHPDASTDGAGSGSGSMPDAAIDGPPAAVCNHAFRLDGHGTASQVLLTGDFVQWAAQPPGAVAFVLGGDGAWTATYPFAQGTWQYKFIVDGNWITDPTNQMTVDDGMGHTNSVYTCTP
jgi:AMP-activated protein kinase-like protein